MKRIIALLLLVAIPGCGAMPVDGTNPTDSSTVVGTCNTAYYNSDLGFGFDLPLTATLIDQGMMPAMLFDALWVLESVEAGITVMVLEFTSSSAGLDDEAGLLSFVATRREGFIASPNTEVFTDMPVTLPNGDLGHMFITVASGSDAEDRSLRWEVMTAKNNRLYAVVGLTFESHYTDATNDVLVGITLSLCVD